MIARTAFASVMISRDLFGLSYVRIRTCPSADIVRLPRGDSLLLSDANRIRRHPLRESAPVEADTPLWPLATVESALPNASRVSVPRSSGRCVRPTGGLLLPSSTMRRLTTVP